MDSTFPLLQLPKKAVKTVLKCFTIPQLIFFSTLSNRAKRLVRSLKQKATKIEIHQYLGCEIVFPRQCLIKFGGDGQEQRDIESLTPCTLQLTDLPRHRPDIYFTLPGFGVREWFEHFSFTFHQPLINVGFCFQNGWKYTFESVCKLLKGFAIGCLAMRQNPCEILRQFPVMQLLCLDKTELEPELQGEDLNLIKKVLLGNISYIQIKRAIPLDLNTLLLMNSTDISSHRSIVTDKELNTFIKLWLKGANPNLKTLALSYFYSQQRRGIVRTFNDNVILKGVKYEVLNGEGRIGSPPVYLIRKRDGTLAEVYFVFPTFLLHVQH